MKITRLKVDSLFGLYNYDIDFSSRGEFFTVLTSPNGFGKTTILRVINSLHVSRLFYLYILKFKTLIFWFDDYSCLTVYEPKEINQEDKGGDIRKNQRRDLRLIWTMKDTEICHLDYNPEIIQKAQLSVRRELTIRHFYDNHSDFNLDFFLNGKGGESFNMELAQIQKQEQFLLQLATVQTDYIGANRIYSVSHRTNSSIMRNNQPVLQVVKDLKELLSEKLNDFQNNFQRLDSKLIDMLLGGKGHDISEDEYSDKAQRLSSFIEELASFGLSNKLIMPPYQSENSKILDVYLTLLEEKVYFYKDLLPIVRLFNNNVIKKNFANKSVILSPQHGLRIESENGDILSADMLSTGEQNQLVLLYDLIFKTPQGSILLIDEPESSLHVAWQNDFVSDMQSIASSKELQIVVATHSPIIVSNTPNNGVVDLYYLQNLCHAD